MASRQRVDASRLAAYDVLKAVRVDDAYANLALPHVIAEHGLSGRDAAFTTELVSGTIRWQGTYDAIIDACLTKPRLEAKVRDALRLGVHQLLAMRVPDHAAISSSVELIRARVGVGPAGLTNAVLRKVSGHDLDGWIRRVAPDPSTDPVGFASVAHSHPRWVVEAFTEALGGADELAALLAADNAAPRVTLVARPGQAEVAELLAAGGEPGRLSPYAVTLVGGDPSAIPAVADGRAGIQDEGSQLVALTLAQADVVGRDARWLDVCAGPGGKAALLAALAAERGALVLANERQHHRARLVVRGVRASSAGLLGVVTGDGTRPPWREESFDRVLVDAPCSGLGALRRRPESRWRRTPADLDDLVPLQRRLLTRAIDAVRPGGVVVYATCSPVLAETSGVVDAVLAEREDAQLEAVRQLWPHRDGTDAMFIATIRRTHLGS
ncbi:transcription antitermination factor NusB [Nocardioides piscis]|uniref:rRNA cytosine-C5-methyltransferase n=1 Tax=Nocardioides piscis TaxID=2714938 RepID=A0A6G7YHY5_9ACTN|nr:transcription antitermination factor NusB [Nocardioides piscis]QIK76390.1 rRNA cytosine-C5-methyltransferase [Nocardioides piscis]